MIPDTSMKIRTKRFDIETFLHNIFTEKYGAKEFIFDGWAIKGIKSKQVDMPNRSVRCAFFHTARSHSWLDSL